MKFRILTLFGLLSTILSGCASFRPVPAGTLPITIAAVEERAIRLGAKATLPAGDYLPDFSSDRGTFYLAPTSVTIRSLGIDVPLRGGLFIPSSSARDQRHAAWVQQTPNLLTGGLLSGGSPAVEIYPFDEPIKFSIKR